jgi:hypothetical protein
MNFRWFRHADKTMFNLKTNAMKKSILFAALVIVFNIASAQKSIDSLFEKYAGKDGFTTVTINGSLCKLAACLGDDDDENQIPANITQIRILTQDDENTNVENFYDLVIRDIDLKNYEEFMRVKESDQDLRILVKTEGKKFREFLLIAGGEDNALIQIKGNMTLDEAKKLSNRAKHDHNLSFTTDEK